MAYGLWAGQIVSCRYMGEASHRPIQRQGPPSQSGSTASYSLIDFYWCSTLAPFDPFDTVLEQPQPYRAGISYDLGWCVFVKICQGPWFCKFVFQSIKWSFLCRPEDEFCVLSGKMSQWLCQGCTLWNKSAFVTNKSKKTNFRGVLWFSGFHHSSDSFFSGPNPFLREQNTHEV